MKKIFYSLLALATLMAPACQNTQSTDEQKAPVTIKATLENGREWKAGDEVVINNIKYTIEEGGKSTVSIDNVKAADYYYAAYDFGSGSIEGTNLTIQLPATQSLTSTTIKPMVASNGNTNLVFKNLLGTLRLAVNGSGTITRVVLSSLDAAISGQGVANMDFAGAPILEVDAAGSRSVTVDLGKGVALPAEIDVVLPAYGYTGFNVTIYGTNDEVMSGYSIPATEVLRGDTQSVEVIYEPDTEAPTYITATIENDADGNPYLWNNSSELYVNGTPEIGRASCRERV